MVEKRFTNTFSSTFHDTSVGPFQGTTMGTFNNSPIADSSMNGVHGQRFYSSLRDSRRTYKPAVSSPTKKVIFSSGASKVREAIELKKAGNQEEAVEIINKMLRDDPNNWCAQEA